MFQTTNQVLLSILPSRHLDGDIQSSQIKSFFSIEKIQVVAGCLPSSHQTWQWKVYHLWIIFSAIKLHLFQTCSMHVCFISTKRQVYECASALANIN